MRIVSQKFLKKPVSFSVHSQKFATKQRKIKKNYELLKRQLHDQTNVIQSLQKRMAKISNMDEVLSKLSENQRLVVQTGLNTATQKTSGKRYTKDWIYSCILIRIKSPKLYRHLRNRELLPLPAPSTISRYIKNIDSSYGFQTKLFELLKVKCHSMPEY